MCGARLGGAAGGIGSLKRLKNSDEAQADFQENVPREEAYQALVNEARTMQAYEIWGILKRDSGPRQSFEASPVPSSKRWHQNRDGHIKEILR
jgi:hypothetical protein